jgi:hypothetical protein
LEDVDVDGKVLLKLILNKYSMCNINIDLAQDRDQWRALVNTVMNLGVP